MDEVTYKEWSNRPRCMFCNKRKKTWRAISWHYLLKHPGTNARFRGSLWRKR